MSVVAVYGATKVPAYQRLSDLVDGEIHSVPFGGRSDRPMRPDLL